MFRIPGEFSPKLNYSHRDLSSSLLSRWFSRFRFVISRSRRLVFYRWSVEGVLFYHEGIEMPGVPVERRVVSAGTAVATKISQTSTFQIIDVSGGQVGDLFIFVDGDFDEYGSAQHTRAQTSRLFPAEGEVIWSNYRRPLLRLDKDSADGAHDTLYAACDPERYRLLGVEGTHRSCATNLREALDGLTNSLSITPPRANMPIPQPFNVFMSVGVSADRKLTVATATSKAGEYLQFTALCDLIIVLSSCPMDVVPISTLPLSDLMIDIF